MGLFNLKNVERDGDFLRNFESRCNGLLVYAEGQPELIAAINNVKEKLAYLVPSASKEAKRQEKIIRKSYNKLKKKLEQQKYEEAMPLIKRILYSINEISSSNT